MEGMMLGGWNSDDRTAELCETEEFVNKLAEMLKDRNVELSEIFEFIASKCPDKTPQEVEYEIRDQIASTYIGLINYVDEVFSKIGTKLEERNEMKNEFNT